MRTDGCRWPRLLWAIVFSAKSFCESALSGVSVTGGSGSPLVEVRPLTQRCRYSAEPGSMDVYFRSEATKDPGATPLLICDMLELMPLYILLATTRRLAVLWASELAAASC